MPLTPTMLLMPSAMPRWFGGKGVGDDRRRVREQAGAADALHDAEDDQVARAGAAGHPVDREQQRGDRVDDEAEVVDPHAAEHVAEAAEADDQHARHDHVAEDHPQQVEAVGRHERVEVDAAEDVRHRDQRDRRVERREQHRRASRSRARSTCSGRWPACASGPTAGSRTPTLGIIQATCAVCLASRRYSSRHADEDRPRAAGERAARGARAARCAGCGPSTASRSRTAPCSAGSTARARRASATSPSAERVRPQSMAQTVSDLEADGLVSPPARPGRRPPRAGRADRARAARALRRDRRHRDGWLAMAIADDLSAEEQAVLREAVGLLRAARRELTPRARRGSRLGKFGRLRRRSRHADRPVPRAAGGAARARRARSRGCAPR